MIIEDLNKYENIVIWGAGNDFYLKFRKQFFVTHIIDKDKTKQDGMIYGVRVYGPEILKELSETLVVVASTRFYDEISLEIKNSFKNVDVISLDEILYIYGYNRPTYCLWGIDAFVRDIFLRGGFCLPDIQYIEVGCNHPFYGSATAALYMASAKGILIEPDLRFNSMIRDMRPRDVLVNCGIGKESGEMKFYKMDNSYRSSFDIDVVRMNEKRGFHIVKEVDIPIRTIDSIIDEYGINPENTYISIPSIGSERDVLDGFDYKKYQVPIVSVGHNSENVLQAGIFKEYKVLGTFPRHKVLVRQDLYQKIMD